MVVRYFGLFVVVNSCGFMARFFLTLGSCVGVGGEGCSRVFPVRSVREELPAWSHCRADLGSGQRDF